jgi:hypothetical protein
VRQVSFSCFTRSDSFSGVPRALGPVIMFCNPGLVFGGTEGVRSRFHVLCSLTHFRPIFMFCASGLVFDGTEGVRSFFMFCTPLLVFADTEGVGSRLHVLRSQIHFRRYRGRHVPFFLFCAPGLAFAVPMVSGPVFKYCALRLIFGGTEGVGSRFHVLRSRTHF